MTHPVLCALVLRVPDEAPPPPPPPPMWGGLYEGPSSRVKRPRSKPVLCARDQPAEKGSMVSTCIQQSTLQIIKSTMLKRLVSITLPIRMPGRFPVTPPSFLHCSPSPPTLTPPKLQPAPQRRSAAGDMLPRVCSDRPSNPPYPPSGSARDLPGGVPTVRLFTFLTRQTATFVADDHVQQFVAP
jgi:hypothetical protein